MHADGQLLCTKTMRTVAAGACNGHCIISSRNNSEPATLVQAREFDQQIKAIHVGYVWINQGQTKRPIPVVMRVRRAVTSLL